MISNKVAFVLLILVSYAQLCNSNAVAEGNNHVIVIYHSRTKPSMEFKLKNSSQIEAINAYWKEYRNFPRFDFSKVSTPHSGDVFHLAYFYPNGDLSYSISTYDVIDHLKTH